MSAGGVLIVHARRLLSQEQRRHGNNPHRPLLAAASAGDDLACREMEEGACIPPPHMSNDATLDFGRSP
jgi:hypothetical protein